MRGVNSFNFNDQQEKGTMTHMVRLPPLVPP